MRSKKAGKDQTWQVYNYERLWDEDCEIQQTSDETLRPCTHGAEYLKNKYFSSLVSKKNFRPHLAIYKNFDFGL